MTLPEELKKAEAEILRLSDAALDEFSKKYKTRSPEGWVYGETFEGGYKAGRKDAEVEFASFLETTRKKLKEEFCQCNWLVEEGVQYCKTSHPEEEKEVCCKNCQKIDAVFGGEKGK